MVVLYLVRRSKRSNSLIHQLVMRFLVLQALFLLYLVWEASTQDMEWMPQEIQSVTDFEPVSVDPTKVISLKWHPRAFLYEKFLTDEECDHIINLAKGKLTKSMVTINGKSVQSEFRTSSGMFLQQAQDEIVKRVEDKIAAWTFLPPENGEAMHVLKYEYGQKFGPHTDNFADKYSSQAPGGSRIATVLMYLSDVIKGGETVFPEVTEMITFKDHSWSECGKMGFAVKPRKGNALLFYSLYPNATADIASAHMGCPVVEGEKWSATKWIHVSPFRKMALAVGCFDEHEMCGEWAAYGECGKNPVYMVGTNAMPGACQKSCEVC